MARLAPPKKPLSAACPETDCYQRLGRSAAFDVAALGDHPKPERQITNGVTIGVGR